METFAYIMAGLLVLTYLAIIWFAHLKHKWMVDPQYETLHKIILYGNLADLSSVLLVAEVLVLFVVAMICGIIKLLA